MVCEVVFDLSRALKGTIGRDERKVIEPIVNKALLVDCSGYESKHHANETEGRQQVLALITAVSGWQVGYEAIL